MQQDAPLDWVTAVGFQMESLHTGALGHLLRGPSRVAVAQALTGADDIVDVDVGSVRTEARLMGRRPIDLAVDVVAADGKRALGIEVKVDSAWSATQLEATVPRSDAQGVLLALGRTRLAITEQDMRQLSAKFDHAWQCIGPEQLAGIVRRHAGKDPQLHAYADHLRTEAAEHQTARRAVRGGLAVTSARDPLALGHWAYFGELLAQREDAWEWERKTLISGPLVTRWVRQGPDGTGDYMEFMGEGKRRSLCVKTYAPSDALPAARASVRRRMSIFAADSFTEVRPPTRQAKTCTVVRFDLSGRTPTDASNLADQIMAALRAGKPIRRKDEPSNAHG